MISRRLFTPLIAMLFTSSCAVLPPNDNRIESYAFNDTERTTLGTHVTQQQSGQIHSDGFILLNTGLDAFVARAALAEKAERSLDVQYFEYHDDLIGKLFTTLLWQAAERGVRVRLLVDDLNMVGKDTGIIAIDSHPNIEIRLFNPFNRNIGVGVQLVSGFGTVTRRMHNKSFTVDNQITVIGGRNIGNAYFDAPSTTTFTDQDVLAIGTVVKDVSKAFDWYWNSSMAYPANRVILYKPDTKVAQKLLAELLNFSNKQAESTYLQALHNSKLARAIREQQVKYTWGKAHVLVDSPEKVTHSRDNSELHLVSQLTPYFKKIEHDLLIVSPYFVPGDEGVNFLKNLRDKGIRIRILTNSLASNDVTIVHAGYSKYRKKLLQSGIELYEINKRLTHEEREAKEHFGGSSKASLHAKTFVLDGTKVFIGSLNLDPRSFYENTEIGLIIESKELADKMSQRIEDGMNAHAFSVTLNKDIAGSERLRWDGYEQGEPVAYYKEPYTNAWQRFKLGLMKLLPFESQL